MGALGALVLALSLLVGAGAQTTTTPATTPVPTCPGSRLKDYLFSGATGIACDSKPFYRPVIRTAVGREPSCQAWLSCKSGSHGLVLSLQTEPPDGMVSAQIQFALYQFIEVNTKLQSIEMHGW